MKSITTLLLFTLSIGALSASARPDNNKETEREVKMSGKFYYGEGLDTVADEAHKIASDDLKLMILQEMMESNHKVTDVDFRDIDSDFRTIERDLEGRTKVVTFIQKSDLLFSAEGEKKVIVSCPEPEQVAEVLPAAELEVVAEVSPVTKPAPAVQATPTPAPKPAQRVVATPAVRKTNSNSSAASVSATRSRSAVNVSDIDAVMGSRKAAAPKKTTSSEPIINELLKLGRYNIARHTLNRYQYGGKLAYGEFSTLSRAQECFFMVLGDNGEIVDILEKGTTPERMGLIKGQSTTYTDIAEDKLIWIRIL